jgi:hypothetical protein
MTFQTERKLILTKDPTVDISNQSQKKKKFWIFRQNLKKAEKTLHLM